MQGQYVPPSNPAWATEQPAVPSNRRRIGIIAAIAAGVVVIVLIVLYATGVFGGRSSGPEAAVTSFFSAAKSGDCDTMWKLVNIPDSLPAQLKSAKGAVCSELQKTSSEIPSDIQTRLVNESDKNATVEVSGTVNGKHETQQLQLTKVDGTWKLDLQSFGQ